MAISAASSSPVHFRGQRTKTVEVNLLQALAEIFVIGSSDHSDRVTFIEKHILPTFQSMPKTRLGRVDAKAVQHILHSYFRQEHGWTLKGLNSLGTADLALNSTGIWQAHVPALEALLAAQQGHGFALHEVSYLAATIERLTFDESVNLLRFAYKMNGFSENSDLTCHQVEEVLVSYVLLYKHADKDVPLNPKGHFRWKRRELYEGRLDLETSFAHDAIRNFDFGSKSIVSPFTSRMYSFDAVSQIIDRMAHRFGRWQDESCQVMRNALESLDSSGSGRVTLEDFYSVTSVPVFELDEPIDELRELGALEETLDNQPRVRIADYILSDANCADFSDYYSVCCISTCDGIMRDLEGAFHTSAVDLALLFNAATNLSDPAVDKEFHIASSPLHGPGAEGLKELLAAIAEHYGGQVPLHSDLFARWLHLAFPQDCPMKAAAHMSAKDWPSEILRLMNVSSANNARHKGLQSIMSRIHTSGPRHCCRILAMLGVISAFLYLCFQLFRRLAVAYALEPYRCKAYSESLPLVF